MLFKKRGNVEPIPTPTTEQSELADYYAILPPVEQHMSVPPDPIKERLFQLLKVGDVVVGRIVSLKEFGLFVQIVSVCSDKARYMEVCDIIALLPASELSDRYSKAVKVSEILSNINILC